MQSISGMTRHARSPLRGMGEFTLRAIGVSVSVGRRCAHTCGTWAVRLADRSGTLRAARPVGCSPRRSIVGTAGQCGQSVGPLAVLALMLALDGCGGGSGPSSTSSNPGSGNPGTSALVLSAMPSSLSVPAGGSAAFTLGVSPASASPVTLTLVNAPAGVQLTADLQLRALETALRPDVVRDGQDLRHDGPTGVVGRADRVREERAGREQPSCRPATTPPDPVPVVLSAMSTRSSAPGAASQARRARARRLNSLSSRRVGRGVPGEGSPAPGSDDDL